MTQDSIVPSPASTAISKRQKELKVKLYDWKKKGYNVSRIYQLIQQDITLAEEEFNEFLNTVRHMEKIEERLYRLDTTGFEDQVKRIEDMIKDPGRIEELEESIIILEENILKRKLDSSGISDNETKEIELRKELDKIRAEELHRIRKDEAGRLRERERKRILEDELERIREEERERLKKTELERIRKEEKERLVWEDRVVHQLKQAKMRVTEETDTRKMTCRSCKGTIPISSSKRPLKVRCGQCGKDYTLRARDNGTVSEKGGARVQYKKCPKCSSPIPIISEKRPLKIICQMCNTEFYLKSKRGGNGVSGVGDNPADLANKTLPIRQSKGPGLETKDYGSHEFDGTGGIITCPTCMREIPGEARVCGYCGSPIDHSELEQKRAFPCPSCGKEIPGDAKICGYCGNLVNKQNPGGNPVNQLNPGGPLDDLELPPSPNEKILDDLGKYKSEFKPLNEYSLPQMPDLSGPGTAPPGSMDQFGRGEGITCGKCGNLVPRGAKFCGVCGNTM